MTESISVFFGVEDYSSLSASCIGGRASTGVEFAEGGRKRMSASPLGSHWTSNFLGFSVPAATSQLGSLLRPSRVGDERGERRKGGDRRSVGEALMLSLAAKTAALSGIVGDIGYTGLVLCGFILGGLILCGLVFCGLIICGLIICGLVFGRLVFCGLILCEVPLPVR